MNEKSYVHYSLLLSALVDIFSIWYQWKLVQPLLVHYRTTGENKIIFLKKTQRVGTKSRFLKIYIFLPLSFKHPECKYIHV